MINTRRKGRNGALVLALLLAFAATGCQDNGPSPEASQRAQHDKPATLPKDTDHSQADDPRIELPPQLLLLYKKLNMRSIPSSFGPRLKHYCESYLFEYFPRNSVHVDSPTQMTLSSGDDTWVVERLSPQKIRLRNVISGPGNYDSTNEYDVALLTATNDIRSDALWIEQTATCTPLHPGNKTRLDLVDHASGKSGSEWACGDFWSGSAITPEYEHWKTLEKLPQESGRSLQSWGPVDMLLINIKDYASLSQKCTSKGQLRRVQTTPVYAQKNGEENGVFTRVETYAHGLLEMTGFVRNGSGHEEKSNFDLIAKEQLALIITGKEDDWINIAQSGQQNAWIKTDVFDASIYATEILPYEKRVLSASEINFKDSSAHNIHREASNNSEVLHTLRDSRTAMTPLEMKGEWLRVKFVSPPDYPLIECGDSAEDFKWIEGWFHWREGDQWIITEKHHHGC